MAKLPKSIISHWSHYFNEVPFTTKDFYKELEGTIEKSNIPGVEITTTSLSSYGMFSEKRLYLKVTRNEFVFHICAAPFGEGFFISWWLGENSNELLDLLESIPLIGILFKGRKDKTLFQLDTEGMFKGVIQSAVKEAIDSLMTKRGLRTLEENQYIPEE